jgi:hypothetical protein
MFHLTYTQMAASDIHSSTLSLCNVHTNHNKVHINMGFWMFHPWVVLHFILEQGWNMKCTHNQVFIYIKLVPVSQITLSDNGILKKCAVLYLCFHTVCFASQQALLLVLKYSRHFCFNSHPLSTLCYSSGAFLNYCRIHNTFRLVL